MKSESRSGIVVAVLMVCALGLGAWGTVTVHRAQPCTASLEDVGAYLESAVNRIESTLEELARRDEAPLLRVPSYSDAKHRRPL